MKRREFLTSSATLVGAAALGGFMTGPSWAADEPVKGGTLIWGHSETTQNLDIHQTGTASTIRVLQNVHDAIVTVDKNLTVIPSLAKSFEQRPDGLTYTFHLRPGVKFHDGKTMTSADVKYSFDRCRAKETGAVNFEVFNDVASIETPDDLTVVITMNRVNAPFLSRLAENGAGAIMPQGSGDQQGRRRSVRGRSSSSDANSDTRSSSSGSTTTGTGPLTSIRLSPGKSPSPPCGSRVYAPAKCT
jgi:peptide/nickel transport system substrate-binding protein